MPTRKSLIAEWKRDEYRISCDREQLDLQLIHEYLSRRSYWAQGRSFEQVQRSINNSLNFGVFSGNEQLGFARVVTDYTTFAWLADVFILEPYRGRGLSKWLIEVIVSHPQLQGLRRWLLATRDAHDLYRRFGFKALEDPARWLERFEPVVEKTNTE
jgi:GNAT superfamily N-acetyltransferase